MRNLSFDCYFWRNKSINLLQTWFTIGVSIDLQFFFYSKSISLKYKNTNRFFITYFQLYSLVVTDISKHVNDIKMHFTVFTVNQRSGVRVKKGCGLHTRQTKDKHGHPFKTYQDAEPGSLRWPKYQNVLNTITG